MSSNPYRAPGGTLELEGRPLEKFRPLHFITTITGVAIGACGLTGIASSLFASMLQERDPAVFSGGQPSDSVSGLLLVIWVLSGILFLVSLLAAGPLFFIWLVRANKNCRALGALDMEFTPGWMVGWFFVPFLNLVKPYEAVTELYQASDPDAGTDDWMGVETPRFVLAWWLSWIAYNFSSSLFQFTMPERIGARMIAVLIGAVAAGLAVVVMVSIHRRQTARHARLRAAPVAPLATRDQGPAHRFL